ncbi:MAG: UvrD-helicase domain-containing protein [Verrucomicrobiota bacterium]
MSTPIPLDFVESVLPAGLSVIEASAGTGKTYAISHLVPRLLLDGMAGSLGEILLVTFTNDAARELSDRVRRVLEKLAAPAASDEPDSDAGVHQLREKFSSPSHRSLIQQALVDIDRLNVSTIHSFCQRTIQSEGTLCGLPVMPEVITSADDFIEEALYDLWQKRVAGDRLLASIAASRGWNIQEDIRFVKRVYCMEDFESVPEANAFDQTLGRVNNAPAEFTAEIWNGLSEFIKSIDSWNQSGGDEPLREGHLQALANAKIFSDPGFAAALSWILELAEHIYGRTNAGKAAKARAQVLPAVLLARENDDRLNRLRWDWQNECARLIRETVESALHANRQMTQDGLIVTLRNALRSPKKADLADRLRKRYKVALIDESQDTDPKQFEIFKNIFIGFEGEAEQPDHRLVMIGDPKQAIYGFRGANVSTYLEARSQARKVFSLDTTYRSPQPLVDAVNAFFCRPDSLLKEGLEFYPAKSGRKEDTQILIDGQPCCGRIEAWIVPDANPEAYSTGPERRKTIIDTVVSEIVRLLNVGSIPDAAGTIRTIEPRDIAVLTNTNVEAEILAGSLKDQGVPAIVASGADVLETEEAAELLAVLRSVHEPRRSGLRYAALATRLLGYDSARIQGIRSDPAKDDETLRKFLQWQLEWERKGIAAAIALIDREEGVTPRIAASAPGERRVTNFRQLIDLLQAASQEYSNRPEHLLRWLSQEIARAGETDTAEERQIQLESDRDAVQVVTMHKAKGLEYNLVFAPFLWSLREPDGIRMLARTKDYPKDRLVNMNLIQDPVIKTALRRSELEDRLRLAYVAMTRAKVRLWIYGGEMGGSRSRPPASPLDWLLREDEVDIQTPEQFEAWAESAKSAGRGNRHAAGIQSLFSNAKTDLILQKAPPPESIERWESSNRVEAGSLCALAVPETGTIWSVTSFSSLTREKNPHGTRDPEPLPVSTKTGVTREAAGAADRNPFADAPGGTLVGTAIHDWMQRWDCGEPDPEAVREHLKQYHLRDRKNKPGASLDESVCRMLKELRVAILPGLECTVAEACPLREASEWHFHLPIRDTLNLHRLAAAFAAQADPEYKEYAPMLEQLSSPDLHGFLQGFMDRLASHGNARGVIDWKTNQLGDHPEAYSRASLLDCAMQSHYLLQTHLYLVALRRYLKQTDPNAELAGAWLVFLRGVRSGTSDGILHIHPGNELLDALDDLFFEGN